MELTPNVVRELPLRSRNILDMKKLLLFIGIGLLALIAACSGNEKKTQSALPPNFSSMSDEERMSTMMRKIDPDSLARFLCRASLGEIPGAQIDTLSTAYVYAIENLRGDDVEKFAVGFENAMSNLSLSDKMATQFKLGLSDSLSVGYDLGLRYVNTIRTKRLDIKAIEKDLGEFRQACGTDTSTYRRFVYGFRTALAVDSGKDLSNDIFNRYINMSDR